MHKGDEPCRIIAHLWALMFIKIQSRWLWRMPVARVRSGSGAKSPTRRTLRANKSETNDWLKFTLEGEGERTHGYAFEDPAF